MRLASAAIAAVIGFAAPNAAFACFTDVPLTRQVFEDAAGSALDGAPPGAARSEFLVGYLSYLRDAALDPPEGADVVYGTIVFVRDGEAWRAVLPVKGENALGVFVEQDGPGVVFVTQMQVEGPGQGFTVARSDDGFRTGVCAEIAFPDVLNQPSWSMETLDLDALQIDAQGRGRLLASGEIDADTERPRMRYWRYDTHDGGRTWGATRLSYRGARVGRGAFAPAEGQASEAARASLKAFAHQR
jgi:hypothetical protein